MEESSGIEEIPLMLTDALPLALPLPSWESDPWSVILVAVAIWVAISLGVSMLGWARLAGAYAHDGRIPERRFRFRSAGFRWGAGYNRGVHFAVDSQALYLWVHPLLRIGHPPLRIPWSDIRPSAVRAGWVRRVDLELANAPRTVLRVTPRLARELAEAAGPSWPGAEPAESDRRDAP